MPIAEADGMVGAGVIGADGLGSSAGVVGVVPCVVVDAGVWGTDGVTFTDSLGGEDCVPALGRGGLDVQPANTVAKAAATATNRWSPRRTAEVCHFMGVVLRSSTVLC